MVEKSVLRGIALRTCSIGVLKIPLDDYLEKLEAPAFKIFGTGFLVGKCTVLTNRHVINGLHAYLDEHRIPRDRRYVTFMRPNRTEISQTFHEVDKAGIVQSPGIHDLGMVMFRATDQDPIQSISPVTIPEQFTHNVGDRILVYGYAFCENLLKREVGEAEEIYRFGPVLQQGYISALAPFENAAYVDRILLDVRTSRGMSGSPVFDPHTGSVLGIHDSGMDQTVAFAVPLSARMISQLLNVSTMPSAEDTSHTISRVQRLISAN